MTIDFVCYYCGEPKSVNDRSDEHIIPSCIGGNRNVTLTTDVCSSCNQFTGDKVDRPFCRDWFIEGMRLIAGVSHRGKRPAHFMGKLNWARSEQVSSYLLEGGANIFMIECRDGDRAIAILADPDNNQLMETVRNVVKAKFSGMRVINGQLPRTAYDDELIAALIKAGPGFNMILSLDAFSWHRAIVKMGLGLACQTFGTEFISSESACRLREFMKESDPQKAMDLELRGRGGYENSKPRVTEYIHPGGDEHLFALMSSGERVAFTANLFGRYESTVMIDDHGTYLQQLPEDAAGVIRGMVWIVDPVAKTTRGPAPIASLIQADS